MITFTVPGDPVGKARPRITLAGGRAHAYTPAKTAAYEQLVAVYAAAAMKKAPLLEHPVQLRLGKMAQKSKKWFL